MSEPPKKTVRPPLKPNAIVNVTPALAATLGSLPAQHVAIPAPANMHVPTPRAERTVSERAAPRAAPVKKTPAERLKEVRAERDAKAAAAKAATPT
jgi:hypothetical protein